MKQQNNYKYYAFISYKHEDKKWAKWLQHKLEYYKLPSSVIKDNPNLPEKIRPVFKDTTDLEPGVLAQKIQDALNSSKFLIVICSPRSANSVWVSKEVQSFIDSGRAENIIPFIISGVPNAADPKDECFPEGLRQLVGEHELLGVNINEMGPDAAAIKVVARMFDLRFDTLWQRYEKSKKIFRLKILSAASIILAILISMIVALSKSNYELKCALSDNIASEVEKLLEDGDVVSAMNMCYDAELKSLNNGSEYARILKKFSKFPWIPSSPFSLPITNSALPVTKIFTNKGKVYINAGIYWYCIDDKGIQKLDYKIWSISENGYAIIEDAENSNKIINLDSGEQIQDFIIDNPINISYLNNGKIIAIDKFGEISVYSENLKLHMAFRLPDNFSSGESIRFFPNPCCSEVYICSSRNCINLKYSNSEKVDTVSVVNNAEDHISDISINNDGLEAAMIIGKRIILDKHHGNTEAIDFGFELKCCAFSNNDSLIYLTDNYSLYEYNLLQRTVTKEQRIILKKAYDDKSYYIHSLHYCNDVDKLYIGLVNSIIELYPNPILQKIRLIANAENPFSVCHSLDKEIIVYGSQKKLKLLDYKSAKAKESTIADISDNLKVVFNRHNKFIYNNSDTLFFYDIDKKQITSQLNLRGHIRDYKVDYIWGRIFAVTDSAIFEIDYNNKNILRESENYDNMMLINVIRGKKHKALFGINKTGELKHISYNDFKSYDVVKLGISRPVQWNNNGTYIIYYPSFFSSSAYIAELSVDNWHVDISAIAPDNNEDGSYSFISNNTFALINPNQCIDIFDVNIDNPVEEFQMPENIEIKGIIGGLKDNYILYNQRGLYLLRQPDKKDIQRMVLKYGRPSK